MKLVDKLRERKDHYYGSAHAELHRVLDAAIARIEAGDALERATNPDETCCWHVEPINTSGLCTWCDYRALVREQEG